MIGRPPSSTRRRIRSLSILLPAVVLTASACGGSSGSDDASKVVAITSTTETAAGGVGSDPTQDDRTGTPEEDRSVAELPFFDRLDVDGELDEVFSAEVEKCVTAALAEDPELLATAEAAEAGDAEAMAVVVGVVFDCTEPGVIGDALAASFAEGVDLDLDAGIGACFEEELGNEDGEAVLVGLMLLGSDENIPVEYRPAVVDLFTRCIPPSLLIEALTADATDGMPPEAIDEACLVAALDAGVMESFWVAMVANPRSDFEDLDPDVQLVFFEPVVGCISLATVIAAEAAADGVELSDATISCMDDEFASMDLASFLIDPDSDDGTGAAVVAALLGCMTPEEIRAMN